MFSCDMQCLPITDQYCDAARCDFPQDNCFKRSRLKPQRIVIYTPSELECSMYVNERELKSCHKTLDLRTL